MDSKDKLNNFVLQILKCLSALIFLVIPLIFSHVLYIFGINLAIPTGYSYESIKVMTFLFLLMFIFLFVILRQLRHLFRFKLNKKLLYFMLIFILFIISTFLSVNQTISLFGSPQKLHGAIFFLCLLIFYMILRDIYLQKNQLATFFNKAIVFTGILVSIYAIMQFLGLDPLSSLYNTRVPLERVFSTFGNANYLAGYMLIMLPLVMNLKIDKYYKFAIFILFSMVLIATRSIFGIVLMMSYVSCLILINCKSKYRYILLSMTLIIFLSISAYFYQKYNAGNMKLYSAFSRFYLIKTTLNAYLSSVQSILFGKGFDTLYLIFKDFKDPMLNIYEDPKYIADSSHNIFIDILYSVGMVGFIGIFYPIFRIISNYKNNQLLQSIILFLLFFSFNIPSVSHYIILMFCLSAVTLNKNKQENPVSIGS